MRREQLRGSARAVGPVVICQQADEGMRTSVCRVADNACQGVLVIFYSLTCGKWPLEIVTDVSPYKPRNETLNWLCSGPA
ncbi:hypothetical protein CERSUDRAFT_84693 [Gelatoporia subvermispora B]|uniref:Uncharacterized protein n=1 Tax=Ceriporiopsis subvermispora (strain B) TaxID=914234 RepID=M2QWJ6_CERS8|nr:hypothetical protein CERSUDRAFT_84693 [Gelatoporia subvermispora B]